jgi:iron(III) transport system ATP-binding protein
MVFQSYAIWPHMKVFDNVAFPLRQMKPAWSRSAIRDRVMRALSMVQLDELWERPAPFLSGGQQQRLALARALVREPQVLLLDEPLSNLDAKLREQMRAELRNLVKQLGLTTLFVTHEQIEALTMSDRIGVMKDGVIVQEGTPAEIYGKPSHAFVADFIGKTNFLKGRITASALDADGLITVETEIGELKTRITDAFSAADKVTVVVRPESIWLGADRADGANMVEGTVDSLSFLGNLVDCVVQVGGRSLQVQLVPPTTVQAGDRVKLNLPPDQCVAMPD